VVKLDSMKEIICKIVAYSSFFLIFFCFFYFLLSRKDIALCFTTPTSDLGVYCDKKYLIIQKAPRMILTDTYQFNKDFPTKNWRNRPIKIYRNDPYLSVLNYNKKTYFSDFDKKSLIQSYGIQMIYPLMLVSLLSLYLGSLLIRKLHTLMDS